jgi:hypothetical protein
VLKLHPIADGPVVVAQVQKSGGLDAGKQNLHMLLLAVGGGPPFLLLWYRPAAEECQPSAIRNRGSFTRFNSWVNFSDA